MIGYLVSHCGMSSRSLWGLTPRQSIELECCRRGTAEVVAGCVDLLGRRDADDVLIFAIGGPGARSVLDGGQQYWLRVWAARALLYAWDDMARGAVLGALADEAWRVREIAAKVVARRLLGETLAAVAELRQDPVGRVRLAAERATAILTAAGA
jgi:HEAT repeat protein